MSKSGSKIREQVAHFLVDIHSHLYKNKFKIMSEILGYCLLILLCEFQQK